ncbi:restriction endonuclease subunit S [Acinetobacter courvalinii]|uniref:restriction endonuclease subunit S n=1 Tax=Acinetobacter courvalinii TaxID=280147 RepID=UPI0021CF4DFF|nr:restriction endonuclease subunit S [Acinetobacter courvalinii]MCU4368297.1 restriction endonuclease subunit S [Acinetobacter courvalinii]MCU4446667.1 restriction endonuclease subunit S [Acinetobacter courvalinii]
MTDFKEFLENFPINLEAIPQNWSVVKLSDIISDIAPGFASGKHSNDSNGIPHLRPMNIDSNGKIDLSVIKYVTDNNGKTVKSKDILFNNTNSPVWVGKTALISRNEEGFAFSNHMTRIRLNDEIQSPKFYVYYINYLQNNGYLKFICTNHVNQASISTTVLVNSVPFILPPKKQISLINDKIDELFSELDNGIKELETAQRKLELYRQSLLKSAIEGELSKEWRETQTEMAETGEQLLARILKERREHWEQEKLKEFAEKGKKPPKDWQDKYPQPVQPDTENLPQLPEGWVWASLDQVMLIKGGIQKKPSRAPVNNKFPFLRVANIYRAQLNLDDIHEIELFEGEIERYKLETGDLLIVEGNGSITEIGRCAIWNGSIPNAVHQNHLIRARPIHVLSQYLETWLNSSDGINYMAKLAVTTSGLYSLSVGKIAQIPVPIPPLNEQLFITTDLASKLEQQKQQLMNLEELQNLNKLQKKNILSDAFTGKLIPQNPNDEPAQVLLGRIQQQREAEALVKKALPPKRSTQKVKKEVVMSKNILDILRNQSDWISGQELATAFGLNGSSKIEEIEQFYEQLRTLSLDDKITVKPDQQNNKEQDLIKLKDNPNAS